MSLLKKRIASAHGCSPGASKKARASPADANSPRAARLEALARSSDADLLDALARTSDAELLRARLRELQRRRESLLRGGASSMPSGSYAPTAGPSRHVSIGSSRDGSPVERPPSAAAHPSSAVAPPLVPSPQELIEAASGLYNPRVSLAQLEKAKKRLEKEQQWHEREALRRRLLERELMKEPAPTVQQTQERQQEHDKQKAEEETQEPEEVETPEPPKPPPSGLSALETLASVSLLAPPNRIVAQPEKPQPEKPQPEKPDLTSERRRKEAERLAFQTRLAEVTKEAILRKMREAHPTHEYRTNGGEGCLAELALRSYAPVRSSRARAGSPAFSVGSSLSARYESRPQARSASPRSASPRTPKATAEACYVGERHPITGLRHGRGVMAYPNGCKYVGEFKDDRRHGFGKVWYPSANPNSSAKFGGVYEGSWMDNQKSGQGRMEYANGDVYEGEWSNDQPNGRGTLTMRNGESYTGSFVDRKKHGFGVYSYPNGEVYEGTWREDACERRWHSSSRCLSR